MKLKSKQNKDSNKKRGVVHKKLKLNNGGKSEIAKRSKSHPERGSTMTEVSKSPEKHLEVNEIIDSINDQLKHRIIDIEARHQIHPSVQENSMYESFGMNNLFSSSTIDSTVMESSDSEDAYVDDITPVNIASNYIKLNKVALKKAFKLLSAKKSPKIADKAAKQKAKFHRTCNEGYSHMFDVVHWESYAYVVRAIRNLILERDWQHLKELIRLMFKQAKILKNYIKEITYLYFLINADSIEPAAVEDYFLLCFSNYDKTKKPMSEFDIWFKNCEF